MTPRTQNGVTLPRFLLHPPRKNRGLKMGQETLANSIV
jgi:hypothetical protein